MRPFIFITLLTVIIGICPAAAIAQDTPKSQTLSADNLQKLTEKAEKGDASAQFDLGVMYHDGHGVPEDYAQAMKWFHLAAEHGFAEAQDTIGSMYYNGHGVPQDYTEAVKWFRMAAQQGNAFGQSYLGFMYETGQGVPQDYAEAMKWYRKSAEQGFADAQHNIGLMYAHGHGVPQNYEEAYAWSSVAAAQGNKDAESIRDELAKKLNPAALLQAQDLSKHYFSEYAAASAQSTPKAQTLSANDIQELTKRAVQGDAIAQHDLGTIYYNGEGVTQNYTEAMKWLRKSAEQGLADAQFFVGVMYDKGLGVPQDSTEAVKWTIRAAKQGHGGAQVELGCMYAVGHDVPQDFEQAYAWLSLAAYQGDNHAAKLRDEAATHLTPSSLLAAQQLSKRYLADYVKHPSDSAP